MDYTIDGETLVVRLPISAVAIAAAPFSASGKTRLVASGSEKISVRGQELRLALNLMVKA